MYDVCTKRNCQQQLKSIFKDCCFYIFFSIITRSQNQKISVRQYGQGVWFSTVCSLWVVHSICDAAEKRCWGSVVSVRLASFKYECKLKHFQLLEKKMGTIP